MGECLLVRRGAGGVNAKKKMQEVLQNITYTGVMLSGLKVIDGNLYVLLILETSGVLTVNSSYTGDIWLCGGGSGGVISGHWSSYPSKGGGGGYTKSIYSIPIISGNISIGAGGKGSAASSWPHANGGSPGGTTSYNGNTANGGSGQNGGSGGGYGGTGQGATTRPFASQDMPPYCAGGGQGGDDLHTVDYNKCRNGSKGGSDGGNGEPQRPVTPAIGRIGGVGGIYGAGNGASRGGDGTSATTYGSGGGGGFVIYYINGENGSISSGGDGYPGCMMMRIPI